MEVILAFRGARGTDSPLEALESLRRLNRRGHRTLPLNAPLDFAHARWRIRILKYGKPDRQSWEIGLLFDLRNALRSGDIWLADSRRYREISTALVPIEKLSEIARLAVPLEADDWLRHRSHILKRGMAQIECANKAGVLAGGAIVDGKLQIDRLERAAPEEAAALVLKLYESMPPVRITDILIEVDEKLRFTDAFTDLRTGIACGDRISVMTVLLADGVNLGLRKMADACDTIPSASCSGSANSTSERRTATSLIITLPIRRRSFPRPLTKRLTFLMVCCRTTPEGKSASIMLIPAA